MDPEALSPLFIHPSELDEPVAWLIPVGFALVALVIAAVGLLRGRLGAQAGSAGIVFLPAIAFALGNVVLMERSKGTDFCGSCHIMEPLIESISADDGSLASFHVSNGAVRTGQACYGCHSGYGIWGDINAKRAGLNHMIHEITGGYDLPLKMRAPFNIDSCLDCHAESPRFRNAAPHALMEEALLSREMGCTGTCHPAAHPAEALSGEGLR